MVEPSSKPDPQPWAPLKEAILALVDSSSPSSPLPHGPELCSLFAADAWLQQQVEARARRALIDRNASLDWLGEARQEALRRLAAQLLRNPELRTNRELIDRTFRLWISDLLNRVCNEAVDWLQRLDRLQRISHEHAADRRAREIRDMQIDVALALESQEEPARTILLLSANGYVAKEIAKKLRLTSWHVFGQLRRGLEELRRPLAACRQQWRQTQGPGSSSSASSC